MKGWDFVYMPRKIVAEEVSSSLHPQAPDTLYIYSHLINPLKFNKIWAQTFAGSTEKEDLGTGPQKAPHSPL